jgi:hypothetical protein
VAKLRTNVHASAAPLSVIRVDLPFVQSVVALSGYAVEVATASPSLRRAGRRAISQGGISPSEIN